MPRYRSAYLPEFRRQMVDLVRSGRTPEELAREFGPSASESCRDAPEATGPEPICEHVSSTLAVVRVTFTAEIV